MSIKTSCRESTYPVERKMGRELISQVKEHLTAISTLICVSKGTDMFTSKIALETLP